jgi:hypothetical protein
MNHSNKRGVPTAGANNAPAHCCRGEPHRVKWIFQTLSFALLNGRVKSVF